MTTCASTAGRVRLLLLGPAGHFLELRSTVSVEVCSYQVKSVEVEVEVCSYQVKSVEVEVCS
ncbi:hypothetical protein EYF80_065544 [Liparis tanakae]|uniref:Uncharacterized protein n=1 Tax=Liparis tanakae TaxID=230148 RepID=A0A4Z2E6R3_9TELE|nr:hypothetical protein EYF80_065544 [Liparis tanakae]